MFTEYYRELFTNFHYLFYNLKCSWNVLDYLKLIIKHFSIILRQILIFSPYTQILSIMPATGLEQG